MFRQSERSGFRAVGRVGTGWEGSGSQVTKHTARGYAGFWLFYQGRCRCGWRGSLHWHRINAEADAEQHNRAASIPYRPEGSLQTGASLESRKYEET